MPVYHIPAMPDETLEILACRAGGIMVDGTLGGCGHALRIRKAITPGGTLIGIDQDQDAIDRARGLLPAPGVTVHLFHGNFEALPRILSGFGITSVDGILVDIGLSWHQIHGSGRGFSFNRDEPLDMRMDTRSSTTAADLVATSSEGELARLFREYGEERWAGRIARHLVQHRKRLPVTTSADLARLVAEAVPQSAARSRKIHPATQVFMSLRIAVNQELSVLDRFLDQALDCLHPGGRLCVLTFHSLEDRMVKQRFRKMANPCVCPSSLPVCGCGRTPLARVLTPKALRPSPEEVQQNPMARSTRLRAVERL